MAIRASLDVGGTAFDDFKELNVEIALGEFGQSSNFRARLDSPHGRHDDDFTIGATVTIQADQDADPSTTIFLGILEAVRFVGVGSFQEVLLSGRDFTARLQDATVEPSVFTDSEVSTIVTNLMDNFVSNVTTTNVNVTETTLRRIAFNQTTVYEALRQLAELSGFTFFVDTSQDLNFVEKAITSSGITLDNTNILISVPETKMSCRSWKLTRYSGPLVNVLTN